ncbi:MAG: hypothetical protein NTW83_11450 [Cyanobacteria bacterium]|nr:hypothetical protein [Cyanobacteriota bacterium]
MSRPELPHLPDWSALPADLREQVEQCNPETQWFWKGLEDSDGFERLLIIIRHALAESDCSAGAHQLEEPPV